MMGIFLPIAQHMENSSMNRICSKSKKIRSFVYKMLKFVYI